MAAASAAEEPSGRCCVSWDGESSSLASWREHHGGRRTRSDVATEEKERYMQQEAGGCSLSEGRLMVY